MLILIILLCILSFIIVYKSDANNWNILYMISGVVTMIFGIISFIAIVFLPFMIYDLLTIDDKINLYQEENKNIEEEITIIVNNYQGYEKEIISNVADMEVLLIKIPELQSNELVKTQMQLYIENNEQIKQLKEIKISVKATKWFLYFGK